MSKDTGGPAFPSPWETVANMVSEIESLGIPEEKKMELAEKLVANSLGMDLRDYFAAKALQIVTVPTTDYSGVIEEWKRDMLRARAAYAIADAMLAERSKQ